MAKTKLVDGIRINIETGLPATQSTERQQKALDSAVASGKITQTAPITSETLAPQSDIDLPTTPTTTASAGLQGAISSTTDAFTENLTRERDAAAKKEASAFESLLASQRSARGETARTAEEFAREGGVDTLQVELKDINQQILEEQEALRKQEERIQTAPGTATAAERDREVGEVRRTSLRKQADLSIIQLARQGRYDSARAVADRAVAAQLEEQTNELAVLGLAYERNKDLFTTAEQREFETAQADRERQLAFTEYKLKAEYDQKIAQADPLYKLELEKRRKELALIGQPTEKERKEAQTAEEQAKADVQSSYGKLDLISGITESGGLNTRVGANILGRAPAGFLEAAANTLKATLGGATVGAVSGAPFGGVGAAPGAVIGGLAAGGVTLATNALGAARQGISGEDEKFAGFVHRLTSKEFIDTLIDAKSAGATFGALSDGERMELKAAASSIADWEIKDSNGNPTGYWDIDEASFKEELNRIKELTQLAITKSGGSLISSEEDSQLGEIFIQTASPQAYYGVQR